MNKLKELYTMREGFTRYNCPVPPQLAEEIKQAESAILNASTQTIVGYLPEEIDSPEGHTITVAAQYVDGRLAKTASALNVNLEDYFVNVTSISADDEQDETDEEDTPSGTKRSKSIGFSVQFADGKLIRQSTAQRTMIEALRYMGLERASKFAGETFKGYHLIGKEHRTPDGKPWQKNVDGWWIYINMSNDRKIICLQGVAKMLNIPLNIILDKNITESEPTLFDEKEFKTKGSRANFSLNGSSPLSKNRSILETVRLFLKEMPDATFADIEYQFPKNLQGSYGVVRTIEDIKMRCNKNKTERGRWFLEPNETLKDADGVRFAVCSEWGDNYPMFQEYIKNELGWTLTEV